MDLNGSQTQKNLMTAFAGESQARNRYSYYAKKAAKDGFHQIAAIFAENILSNRWINDMMTKVGQSGSKWDIVPTIDPLKPMKWDT